MEQDSTTELHLSRIREVKDLAALTDDVRDVVKEEVILENHHHHQLDTKVRMVTSSSNDNSGSGGGGGAGGAGGGGSAGGGGGNGGGGVVSVPVSLPIGSMITGTAFNVITPDQLPHFKPMLCVDNNGYLSSGAVSMGGDLKTIVIQQQQTQQQQQQQSGNNNAGNTNTTATNTIGLNHDGSGSNNSHDSMGTLDQTAGGGGGGGNGVGGGVGGNTSGSTGWAETTSSTQHMEVFQIRCKTTCAELYRSKLGSGGRGRCVKYKDKWHTPSEFEHVCGRGSSKDWKRSIKYGGKSLQSLIDEGTLTPHATNCSCTVCCDDEAGESASGPVRLFTPYKRRKRNQTDLDVEPGPKRKRNTHSNNNNNNNNSNTNNNNTSGSSINNNNVDPTQAAAASVVDENNMFLAEDNITSKDEPWAALNDSLDTSTELVDQTQMGNPYERETFVVNINDTGSIAVLDSSQSMKNIEHVYCTMVKATGDFKRLLNEMKQNYERRIEVLQKERDAAVSAMRVQVHTDIDDPNISGSLHGNEIISAKKCANCNREALAECSLCRKTPYCSEFCQRKDWNAHQVECARNPQTTTQQVMLLIDDQS
ncbi:deformed epidermal autoregulatory factor 1 isoform X1 [Drosophila sulfurigaster albostrigata]|uniref:deformed epidermal autoregulatory factor 1 isoform X1 n=1 Tax=Drosophila sulfurigaster albostrigata TaxID=89887 RepID=UPI002D2183F0|nr:deformed epidermal autoregulatory factor 1 isoform X1 [Drosophila sulfurigaster albostrigata]